MITSSQLIDVIEKLNTYPFDVPQKDAILYGNGPIWIIAGPGTGKTEVLVIRTLKLLCCDGVDPQSIMITTFTEKAAKSLEDRIREKHLYLTSNFSGLQDINIHDLRIGTFHSLCNDILQEYRYSSYRNIRLLDDIETKMLIRLKLAREARNRWQNLETGFDYVFSRRSNKNLWDWTKALDVLLSRVIQDYVDIASLKSTGGKWKALAESNDRYGEILTTTHNCDFARLQRHFLDFLSTPQGRKFLKGDTSTGKPPMEYFLVDEYQDTNPVQEAIFFKLAESTPHNLVVVGDDDQALYRFRGATVESMTNFGNRCTADWGIAPKAISLVDNHRSHDSIVNWLNKFIKSFNIMQSARVLGKPDLVAAARKSSNYPAVGYIEGTRMPDLTTRFAETVQGLVQNRIIDDYSQCVLLLRSTKDSVRLAGPYIDALRNIGIPVYNPRSKAYIQRPEVQEILGTFLSIVDPGGVVGKRIPQRSISQGVDVWLQAYEDVSQSSRALRKYVETSLKKIASLSTGQVIEHSMPAIFYRIISHSPFVGYQNNPTRDSRLSKFTRLIEAFSSQSGRGLYTGDQQKGMVSQRWLRNFYYIFCGYLAEFGIDEEVICPLGMLPLMTVHQAKGLEFDVVFVGQLASPRGEHYLERELNPFRFNQSSLSNTPDELTLFDAIRFHFVAYSRAKEILVLLSLRRNIGRTGTVSFGEPARRLYDSDLELL